MAPMSRQEPGNGLAQGSSSRRLGFGKFSLEGGRRGCGGRIDDFPRIEGGHRLMLAVDGHMLEEAIVMKRQEAGFTLIELVIVIILLGILGAAITPRFQDIQDNARLAVVNAGVGAIKSGALIDFAARNGVAGTSAQVTAAVDLDGAVVVKGGLTCAAAGSDTTFTVVHADDSSISAAGVIPDQFCDP